MYAYISPPVMVRQRKPAHCGDTAFTDKTGGCNSKADVVERTFAQRPEVSTDGNLSRWKVTGGADFTTKPIS